MNKITTFLSAVRNFIHRHKCVTITLLFAVFITFIDDNNLIRRLNQNHEIGRLKKEIETYKKKYEDDTRQLNELITNPDKIEKIAREKYLMKRPNEDIYVFNKED
ncbi:Cell division protein FtsL [termite gut metagenome]|uniref:Cell division protein FtsL n=1 Tax=termite gut metagenome TaxID=433724 RepID=A0A5J4RS21_9ZZZZ